MVMLYLFTHSCIMFQCLVCLCYRAPLLRLIFQCNGALVLNFDARFHFSFPYLLLACICYGVNSVSRRYTTILNIYVHEIERVIVAWYHDIFIVQLHNGRLPNI